jgi:hypothetical protein
MFADLFSCLQPDAIIQMANNGTSSLFTIILFSLTFVCRKLQNYTKALFWQITMGNNVRVQQRGNQFTIISKKIKRILLNCNSKNNGYSGKIV